MIYFALFLVGLAFGSFVNALVWRLHEQETSSKERKDPKLSISKGRSMCPNCKHELAAKDLIPVLSWVSLGGKCRYCKKPISAQYPIVELATAFLFVQSYFRDQQFFDSVNYPQALMIIWLAVVVGLVALFIYDLKWMILPDRIVFPLMGLAVIPVLYEFLFFGFDLMVLGSALLGVTMIGGLFYILFTVSNGRWIGGGDVKFGVVMGLLLGPILSYLALLIASFAGSIIILTLMALRRVNRNQQVPFGPFLIIGTYISMICGQTIVDWYSNNFLGGLL